MAWKFRKILHSESKKRMKINHILLHEGEGGGRAREAKKKWYEL